MRILIHSINFFPELTGIGKYAGELAEWLVAQGHDVRIVTAPPYYPQWRVAEGYANKWYKEAVKLSNQLCKEKSGTLMVYRCPLWVPSKLSGLKRLLHLASFALSSFPIMLRQVFWQPNVVLVVEPPLFCAPQAWLVARLSGAKAWLHIQDFEVDAAFDLGILQACWLKRWVLLSERYLMRRFDRVSTISVKMQERLGLKDMIADRMVLFPNWVDLAEIYPLTIANAFRHQLGLSTQHVVVLYSGNMGEKQGLEIILDAAAKLQQHKEIHFVLCGDGVTKSRLQANYADLTNVLWLPLQPLDKLNELLNMADVHLLPQRGDVADLVMPSKLLGMLASGRPVISTAASNTQVGSIVSKCGILTSGEGIEAIDQFVDALLQLAVNPNERIRLGRIGRFIAENTFSKAFVLNQFEQELIKIVG